MSYKTNLMSSRWIPITILQILSLVVTLVGIVLLVAAVKYEGTSATFITGLLMLFGGSVMGVIMTLYSLKRF